MDDKINKIIEIIGDYRTEDIGLFYNTKIDNNHINRWLNQFKNEDKEFLVDELLHLLPNSYLKKEQTLRIIFSEFDTLSKDYGYDDINLFFDETRFLDCQSSGKSQKVLLDFVDIVLKEKYNRSLSDCGNTIIKNWIYIDDVLASGGTFKKEILAEIDKFGKKNFIESEINIIASFVILHNWAVKNVKFAIQQTLNYDLASRMKFYRVAEVENSPTHYYYNPSPKFNHVYPLKSEEGVGVLDFIQENMSGSYEFRNEQHAFRNHNCPKEETFFSTPENRIRYENILLNKGFEIIKSIDNITPNGLRPLGMTNPSNKTLGTGTHFFTWRNVPNTCPIVFWWGTNNWYPLFPVKQRGGNLF